MSPYLPLKLSSIEVQHLQELYDAAGIPRDVLPYTAELDQLCLDFQDRAFKNAGPGQVYGALVKYVKSSKCPKTGPAEMKEDAPNAETIRKVKEHRAGKAKLSPYTPEFEQARKEFIHAHKTDLSEAEFYLGLRLATERSPIKAKKAAVVEEPQPV